MSERDVCVSSVRGDLARVKFLVENEKYDPKDFGLALMIASTHGHIELVKYLVEKGANVRNGNDFAFRHAAKNGHLEVVKFLVSKGADIHAVRDFAFFYASRNNHLHIVKYLVEKGFKKDLLSEKQKRYISLCEKIERRRRILAANRIGSWWIPICYDLKKDCGKRMMERSWQRVKEMYDKK